ncbi:hypothetical protein ACLOAU_16330 [Niabella sp. CJ426]|uniref:hypothetical protein n=1 Tax=Niabella sp. CJ426 TaxID=3393740 RepID=UPI003D03706C
MSDKKRLVDLFKAKGLIFPTTAKEVEEFEKFNIIDLNETPNDWENPEAIIRRGLQKIQKLKTGNSEQLASEIQELKMVARKGSNLPQHIINKMKANHKKND